jgi:hypothetical protein
MSKPRPVLIFGAALAALTALTTYADIENMIPTGPLNWIRLGTVILGAGGAFWVQSQVTPLANPQAKDGRPLVPSPPARVPAGTPDAALDAGRKAPESEVGDPAKFTHRPTTH